MSAKRILEIGSPGLSLTLARGFLQIKYQRDEIDQIPIEDLFAVIFTGFGQYISTNLIQKLCKLNIMIVFCDDRFLRLGRPKGSYSKVTKLTGKEEEIRLLLQKKVSISSIAKIFEVNRRTVSNFIDTRNLA